MESFPRDVEGAEDSIFPFRMEKKERERERERRFRSYFLRGATPSIGKADGGKKVRGAALACHVP